MKDIKLWKVSRLLKLIINSKEVILLVSLIMCDTELLTMKVKESMNACKSEMRLEERFVYYFISLYYFLLLFTISFLFKSNFVTSVAVDLSLCQLWFRYKFVEVLSSTLAALSGYVNASINVVIGNIDAGAQLNSCCFRFFCFDCVSELDGVLQVSTLQFRWFLITTGGFFKVFGSALFFLQMYCSS